MLLKALLILNSKDYTLVLLNTGWFFLELPYTLHVFLSFRYTHVINIVFLDFDLLYAFVI